MPHCIRVIRSNPCNLKNTRATNFYSLPMIAESFRFHILQIVSSTFTVISSLFHKKPKVEMGAIILSIEVSENPVCKQVQQPTSTLGVAAFT